MPSFLNKVFGYKKHDDKETARPTREASDSALLDGKYEAILPVTSPSASSFAEAHSSRDLDRGVGFSLFKPRTRGVTQKTAQKRAGDVPHLALRLPGPKENSDPRALGVVFEADPDSQIVLDDAVIAAKRLNPLEALILVRACAQAIAVRGLETLGIMHPHWLSASADVQRRLISLFIRSLTQTKITTLSPTPASPSSAFENELQYTRSPHDVAAVLRWGLRHLSLENGHFGKDNAEWGWYNTFFRAERNASFPPKGFSELLVPHLPTAHAELLTTTLNLISSLASHAEANSISGSKLSKFLGLWLLVATRAERSDDWNQFYARWERSGRILEHLFLARLRDESLGQRLPTRLQELVKYYPYNKGVLLTDDDLLPRPRFSTRQYDALFVRVDTLLAHSAEQPKQHPIQLLLEAFQLPIDNPSGDVHIALWNTLKTTVFAEADSSNPEGPQFSRVFVDETIHLLSLIPADINTPTSPTFLASPITPIVSRDPSSSISKAFERAISRPNASNASTPATPTSPSSFVIADWAQFTLSGFGDAPTTQPLAPLTSQDDDDVEVTQPPTPKSSRHRGKSRTRRRQSEEDEPSGTPPRLDPEPPIIETKLASVRVVQVDEAFIDFWSDAIVDPISANWPTFVVCGLKQIPNAQPAISWLIIEQGYSRQEQPSRVPSPDGRRGRSPRPSFRSDISGFRINSVFASARKRLSVFNKSATDLDVKKLGGKILVAGELGEVLVEEDPASSQVGARADGNGAVRAAVTSGTTTDVADQLKANQNPTPIAGTSSASVVKEEAAPIRVAAKAPSIEPTPLSIGVHNGSASASPPPPVRPLDETISVERGSPRTLDVVNPKNGGSSTSVTKNTPLPADTSDLRPTQGIRDSTGRASELAPSVGDAVAQEVQIRQGDAARQSTADDKHPYPEPTSELSFRAPEIIALAATVSVVAADVVGKAPEPTVQEVHAAEQPPQTTFADPAAALPAESIGAHEIDNHPLIPATEIVAIATGAQLEPHLATCVASKVEEDAKSVAKSAEIPTPALECVALVEETSGQEAFVDGHAGAAQVSSTVKPEEAPDAVPHEVIDDAPSRPAAAELQATLEEVSTLAHPVEASSSVVAILPADTGLQAAVAETQHVADQVLEVAAADTQAHVQDAIDPATETPESLFHEDRIDETPEPVPEQHESADEIRGSNAHESALTIAPESVVEAETREPVVETVAEAIPLVEEARPSSETEVPTQVHDVQAAGVLPTGPNPEATVPALATIDEIIAVKVETLPAPDVSTEEAQTPVPESISVADTPEVANGADEPTDELTPVVNEEAQVLVLDATPIAGEPVSVTTIVAIIQEDSAAHDAPAPIETDRPSSTPAPQSVDDGEHGRPPTVAIAVSIPEEIVVEVDTRSEPVPPTADAADEELPVAEEPLAPSEALVEETEVVVIVASEPETLVVEPPVIEVNAPAPVVEDALSPLEAEELPQGVVEAAGDVVASPPGVASTAEGDETVQVNNEVVVNDDEPVDLAIEPAVVGVGVPMPTKDALAPMEAESTLVEASEDVVASQPEVAPMVEVNETTTVDIEAVVVNGGEPVVAEVSATAPAVEDAPAPVQATESPQVEVPEDVIVNQPEVASTVEVNETTEIEVIVNGGELVVIAVESAVIEVSAPAPEVEDVPVLVESEESAPVEASEDVIASPPVAPIEAEESTPVEASQDIIASQPEVASMVVVDGTTEIEVVVVNDGEPVVIGIESAVVEVSVVEDALAPEEVKESAPVEASEDVVSQPKAVPTDDVNERTKVDEPQAVDHAEQRVNSETNVSTHEPASHSEEIAPTAS